METPQDPQPFQVESGIPEDPMPFEIERGKLYTLAEAARFLERHPKLVQRWHARGLLPSRYEQVGGHHAVLVTGDDILRLGARPRHGVRRPRRPRRFISENGVEVRLRAKPIRKEKT